MGNEASHLACHPKREPSERIAQQFAKSRGNKSSLDLDALGGYYRPAVGRKEELDIKTQWLGQAVLGTADEMEHALDLQGTTDKKTAMALMGGPKTRTMGFGTLSEKPPRSPAPNRRPGTAGDGPRAERAAAAKAQGPSPEASGGVGLANGSLSKSMGSLSAKSALQGVPKPGTTPMRERKTTATAKRTSSHEVPLARQGSGTSPQAPDTRPATARSAGSTSNGRQGKAASAAAAASKQAEEAEMQLRKEHWRVRVARAKRRLYLYLRAYMAWMSVLRKKRKGYAQPLTIESLPIMLANALGDNAAQFGTLLHEIEQRMPGVSRRKDPSFLSGFAERWRSMASRKDSARSGRQATIKEELAQHGLSTVRGSSSSVGTGRAWEPPPELLSDSGPLSSSLAPQPPPHPPTNGPPRRRGARGTPQGSGGAAAASVFAPSPPLESRPQQNNTLTRTPSGRRVVDTRLLATYGAKANPRAGNPGRKSLVDVVAAASSKGDKLFKSKKDRDHSTEREAEENGGTMISLKMLLNKANAQWVEQHMATGNSWSPPQVVDFTTMRMGGVDVGMYEQVSNDLLAQGKMAIQMVYIGEDQVIGAGDSKDAPVMPAVAVDLWRVLSTHYAYKVPHGSRLTGLTLLDRRMLQSITDVEKQAGPSAAAQAVFLLSIDANLVPWVTEQVVQRCHWGLREDQVIIVSIQRFPGIMWDDENRVFCVTYSHEFPYISANTGFALLALNWPSHAFTVAPCVTRENQPIRQYIAGSVLQHLEQQGVEYMYSCRLCDFEALHPNMPTPDPDVCAPALYTMDTTGASGCMQVIKGTSDSKARWLNSVVMAPAPGSPWSCNVSMTDVQSTSTRPLVNSIFKQQGGLYSCTSRYLFSIPQLKNIVTGPSPAHMKVEVKGPCAYLYLDMGDVTSVPGARCAAVLAPKPTRGPEPRTTVFPKDWIRDASSLLVLQEAQPSFRARALRCLGNTSSTATLESDAADVTALKDSACNARGAGARILLLVRDNAVSRQAYRMARELIKLPGDVLILMHVVSNPVVQDDAIGLLATFSNVMTDAQTKRFVVCQEESLSETVIHQVEELKPDMLVLGTESLVDAEEQQTAGGVSQNWRITKFMGNAGSSLSKQATSLAMALARTLTDVPLLIVKSNSAGELFRQPEAAAPPLRVMVEAQSISTAVLHWLSPRLSPRKDIFYLARPFGCDQLNLVTPQSQRILNVLSVEVASFGRNVKKVPMREGPSEGFPPACVDSRIDILAVLAPAAKITPPHILDIIRTARSNILVWRGGAPKGGL